MQVCIQNDGPVTFEIESLDKDPSKSNKKSTSLEAGESIDS